MKRGNETWRILSRTKRKIIKQFEFSVAFDSCKVPFLQLSFKLLLPR
ncbi:hypothetical protein [Methanimicrococcus hongohii]|nr:hypothetical protein [Methanimicrococcus sp. Hf6]